MDYIETDQAVWLVTEAVEGASLRTVLLHAHQLEPEQALANFTGILAGLAHAHERGLVHGDIKPENVLVEASGTAKLVDFGQSVRAGQATTGGTAAYMAPEAVRGELLTASSDLYSVGVALYEALTGRPPFLASTEDALLQLQLNEPPPPIPGIPAEVGALVERLLAKDPAARPASAVVVQRGLESAVRNAYGTEWRRRAGVAELIETTARRFPTMSADAIAATAPGSTNSMPFDPPFTGAGVTKGVSVLRWLLALQLTWFFTFGAGAVLLVWTFYENGRATVNCESLVGIPLGSAGIDCSNHHSLALPILLIVLGFIGFVTTGLRASTWAVKRFGTGLVSYWRRRPSAMVGGPAVASAPMFMPGGPMGPPPPAPPAV